MREARDRLTSTTGTRPAFDYELLRQFAQNRLSGSLVIIILVCSIGALSGVWTGAITAGTWEAALASASVALSAQKIVAASATSAFALCRPPGHHAHDDLYGGYERLVERIVLGFGGSFVSLIGDGAVAIFGYPVQREDDAERAVRAGLELVAAVRDGMRAANR